MPTSATSTRKQPTSPLDSLQSNASGQTYLSLLRAEYGEQDPFVKLEEGYLRQYMALRDMGQNASYSQYLAQHTPQMQRMYYDNALNNPAITEELVSRYQAGWDMSEPPPNGATWDRKRVIDRAHHQYDEPCGPPVQPEYVPEWPFDDWGTTGLEREDGDLC